MKLRSLWAALLAAALFLTGCAPSGPSSEPETSGYDLTELTNEYLAPIAISGIGAVNWEDPSELSPDQLLSYYAVWAMPVERNLEEPEKFPPRNWNRSSRNGSMYQQSCCASPNIMTRRPACISQDMWGVPPGMR